MKDNWFLRCLFSLRSSCFQNVNIINSKTKPWTFSTNDSNWFTSTQSSFRFEIQWLFVIKAPVQRLVFAIRMGRSAIPVSAVQALSQINFRSLHSRRTRQGIRESTEIQVTTDHDQFWIAQHWIALFVYSPATHAEFTEGWTCFARCPNQVRNLVTQTVPRKYNWTGIVWGKCSTMTIKNRLAIIKFNGNFSYTREIPCEDTSRCTYDPFLSHDMYVSITSSVKILKTWYSKAY